MISNQHQVVIVTPVYEDTKASGMLFKEISNIFGDRAFVVAVDDGSVHQPLTVDNLANADVQGVVLKLRRNVGHQKAIAIGLHYVSELLKSHQKVVVMDSDGEDLPNTIQALLDELNSNTIDVAVAERKSRIESFRFKAFYAIYKQFFSFMTGRTIGFGNFMALKPAAVKRLVAMQELSVHVAGAVLASKLRTQKCLLDRGPRYAGQSKMNFVGLALHGFKGLMVFAEDVLVRVGILCTLVATLSILGASAAVVLKLIGFSTPGWFSIALGILVLIFMQTGALALMTLMLTGIVRGGSVTSLLDYKDFVGEYYLTQNRVAA